MHRSEPGPPHQELIAAIRNPQVVLGWTMATWEIQVRLSRRLRLLSRLAAALEAHGVLADVPAEPGRLLRSDLQLSRWRTRSMRWAVERVGACLSGRGYPLVLLKGAAYLSQQLGIARGRLPSDLDILVPKDAIGDAQEQLRLAGWQEMELDAHDQRYYREWSHEASPMRHPAHRMELDLHHNVLPPIGKPRVDAALLLDEIEPSPWTGWHVLSGPDQFLHAAAHLFCDSVLRDRLRDLVDLDGIAREMGPTGVFWNRVVERARTLGLTEECALACRFLAEWFDTPMGETALLIGQRPVARHGRRHLLFSLLSKAMTPLAPDEEPGVLNRLVDLTVLSRYHLNRMPIRLLIPHLAHKLKSPKAELTVR
ncbi:MAG: nucleotidyltransferase family protein [Burkholderiaceae bacterium]|nr:nucleotidyltransferase family protein [Burkholderiaceae bacterium]